MSTKTKAKPKTTAAVQETRTEEAVARATNLTLDTVAANLAKTQTEI